MVTLVFVPEMVRVLPIDLVFALPISAFVAAIVWPLVMLESLIVIFLPVIV